MNLKVKKTLCSISLGLALVMTTAYTPSHALVVSDPGTYTRMALQLEEASKQVELATSSVNELKSMNLSMTGNLQRGSGIERIIREVKNSVSGMTKSIFNISDGKGLSVNIEDLDMNDVEDVQVWLDEVFVEEDNITDTSLTKKRRDDFRQLSLKGAIEAAETTLAGQEASLEKFEELAGKIDETETLKDSMDLQSRLLNELIIIQQRSLMLLAQLVRAESAMQYTGIKVDDTGQVVKKMSGVGGNTPSENIDRIFKEQNEQAEKSLKEAEAAGVKSVF
jgi:hypothetical protein